MPLLSNSSLERFLIGGLTAGKRWARGNGTTGTTYDGTGTYGGYWATVTGLTFTPGFVLVYQSNDDYAFYSTSNLMPSAHNRAEIGSSLYNNPMTINANGFSVKFALSNDPFEWIALE